MAAEQPGLSLIEDYHSPSEKNALIASCDCYVSLHRSEGLGLTMAEAMYLGKPVIATGYSGNLDFMTPANSWLVDHEVVRIGDDADPYPADAVWAEPDLDHAAACMREVAADPVAAATRAQRGADDIRRTHSPAVTGRRIEEILLEVTPPRPARQSSVPPAQPGAAPRLSGLRRAGRAAAELAALTASVRELQEQLAAAEAARVAGDTDSAAQVRKLGERLDELSARLAADPPATDAARDAPR